MKLSKRLPLISLMICTLFSLSLLSACGKDQEKSANTSTNSSNTATINESYNPPVTRGLMSARPKTAIDDERFPEPLAHPVESADRKSRIYPMQPPTIPHHIEGYQLDTKANQCMSCHSRNRTEESGAIMVSVTHYMNRDGQFLAEISPRRYFCTQCHVVQTDAKPIIESTFIDMHSLSVSNSADAN